MSVQVDEDESFLDADDVLGSEFNQATLTLSMDSQATSPAVEVPANNQAKETPSSLAAEAAPTEKPAVNGPAEYFATRSGSFDHAVENCRPIILPDIDGDLLGVWLLTEIDHWDIEKERLVMLTDNTLIVVKYDFIILRVLDYKRLPLRHFDHVVVGEITYPTQSVIPGRSCRGVRAAWNRGLHTSFTQRWNPWSRDIPWVTLCSHPLCFQAQTGNNSSKCDSEPFGQALVAAVEKLNSTRGNSEKCTIETKPIVVENYVGLLSLFHNVNDLGFFKHRGKISF